MAEPYFSQLVIIVEGESEREALPVFCEKLGINFDKLGISIVAAGGKSSIDILAQVYQSHQIPVYIIFDNDKGRRDSHASNRVLCRLLNIIEADIPNPQITDKFAVMDGDWESQMSNDLEFVEAGLYLKLELEARQYLGIGPKKNKSLVARYIAFQLVNRHIVPNFVERIGGHLMNLAEELDKSDVPFDENSHAQPEASSIEQVDDQWDSNLPF
jgi:putative ATP-dependent endonuclease of OLD family